MKMLSALALAALLAAIPSLQAAPCYALTSTNHLLAFDSATPGSVTDTTITGLDAGCELIGLDMRTTVQTTGAANPGVGTLWALGLKTSTFQLYVVSPAGAATKISADLGSAFNNAAGGVGDNAWGFAFDPARDRFEAVGVFYNIEINPNTAAAVRKADVFTSGSANPAFSGAAFATASFGAANNRYYIADTGDHSLAASNSISSGGLISSIGATNSLPTNQPGDIAISQSTALYGSNGNLYTLDLSTGATSFVNTFPMGTDIRGLVIIPASFPAPLSVNVAISGRAKVTTEKTKLKIKGTASSQAGVTLVQYKVGKGGFKTASGTTSWSFNAKLKPGKNKIYVQATGGNAAVSSLAHVTVTSVPTRQ